MERQFTSTVYIVDEDRVLLIFHRKLQKWLPPGGHLNPNELPPDGAKREVFEETGLKIEFIEQENIWIERWNAISFERPYLCLLQEIPATVAQAAHQHMDFIYLGRPIGGELKQNISETDGIRWFTREEISQLKSDEDIFLETQQVIYQILTPSVLHG